MADVHKPDRWFEQFLRLPIIEIVVTTALFLVLYFPLDRKDLGEIVGVVGILLAVSRLGFQQAVADQLRKVDRLADIIDLHRESQISSIDKMLKSYVAINEAEFRGVKDHIIAEAAEKLHKIAAERKSDELSTGAYYSWLIPILQRVRRGDYVRAVSLMHDIEWDDSEPERKFFEENINIIRRGGHVERVFVMPRAKWEQALRNEKIRAHARDSTFGLTGWFVDLDHLQRQDARLLERVGHGFIEISGRVALVDRFSEHGEVRGQVTMEEGDLRRLSKIFDELKVYAAPLRIAGAASPSARS